MFSESQRIWIVTNFRKEKGLAQLRRDLLREYKPVNHKTVPNLKTFQRIITTFLKTGSVEGCKRKRGRKPLPDTKISEVKNHFETHPRSSLRKASREIGLYVASVHKTLKKT